ncbi:hypothetical protein XELAEV_18012222mg [Xenopus laevis]|uniref:Uncharacterized protein n=1 Tax=Xenopus laevis TaxID=8355 RepID=A0A974HY73_XENLA|nr:hypothetical protein XELAEV_18012222mg [Xenopus laevis]
MFSPHTPLWYNPALQELALVPDPHAWVQCRVKCLGDVFDDDNSLLSFQQLKDTFNLPNSMLFRFFQLRHALTQQFRSIEPRIEISALENVLRKDCLRKPLSTIYVSIRPTGRLSMSELYQKWITNIPDLTQEQWTVILADSFSPLIRARDRLIQFKYLHWAYYTPYILHRINPAFPDGFWMDIASYISHLMALPVEVHPTVLLLNYLSDTVTSRTEKTLLTFLLFYAKKAIAIKWKEEHPPTIAFWITLVEQALPILEQVYYSRGCPTKFNAIWSLWILQNESYSSREPDSSQLTLDWLLGPE